MFVVFRVATINGSEEKSQPSNGIAIDITGFSYGNDRYNRTYNEQ